MTPLARTRNRLAALVATAALGLGAAALVASSAAAATSWTDHEGNDNGALSCTGNLVKVDSDQSATVDGVRFTSDGTYLSFQSLEEGKAVGMVSVKGGNAYRVYTYEPPATSGSGLRSPTNGGGNVPQISHYTVCVTAVPTTIPPTTTPPPTVPETTVPPTTVPETTLPPTTVPETTVPETTLPPTTVPEPTLPETTVPGTTTPESTEPPASSVVSPPAESAPTTAAPTPEAPPATVVEDPSAPATDQVLTLPVTGSNGSLAMALLAAALIAGGGTLLVITRRRAGDDR